MGNSRIAASLTSLPRSGRTIAGQIHRHSRRYEAVTSLAELQQSNEELKIKDQARSAAVKTRDDKLKSLASLLRIVVKGVQCRPGYGEDSPLYRAMGSVPFSERKTGLIRRPKAGTGDPAANGEAAV